jgi:hypothetical protein
MPRRGAGRGPLALWHNVSGHLERNVLAHRRLREPPHPDEADEAGQVLAPLIVAAEPVRELQRERSAAALAAAPHHPPRRHTGTGGGDHAANVPPIAQAPAAADAITVADGVVQIPE